MKSTPRPSDIDALGRWLLDAARLEGPRASARQRTFVALAGGAMIGSAAASSSAATVGAGVGATAGTASGATAAGATAAGATAAGAATVVGAAKIVGGSAALIGVAKAVAVGAISGAIVLGASQKLQQSGPTRYVPSPSPTTEITPAASSGAETTRRKHAWTDVDRPSTEERLERESPIELARPERASSNAPEQPAPRPFEPSSGGGEDRSTVTGAARRALSLAEEITALDRARDALLFGDPGRALRILDEYEREKTGAKLSAEATLLRIDAWLARGERARAASLARTFLREHPESPVADRMRAMVDADSR